MLSAGTVMYAPCNDLQGRNRKTRTLLVLGDTIAHEPVRCVATSSQYDQPLPPTQIRLPHANRGGRCKTGLTKPCAAICNWIVTIDPADIERIIGFVNVDLLGEILAIIDGTTPTASDSPEP